MQQNETFKYILCYCSSSTPYIYSIEKLTFKYILCYCSSVLDLFTLPVALNLNTSYVIVHRMPLI